MKSKATAIGRVSQAVLDRQHQRRLLRLAILLPETIIALLLHKKNTSSTPDSERLAGMWLLKNKTDTPDPATTQDPLLLHRPPPEEPTTALDGLLTNNKNNSNSRTVLLLLQELHHHHHATLQQLLLPAWSRLLPAYKSLCEAPKKPGPASPAISSCRLSALRVNWKCL